MEYDVICRTCLGSKSLNPIFKNQEHHERFSLALENTTGLKVDLNDGLPQNICIKCMSQINSILKFRAKCKDAETYLLQMYKMEPKYQGNNECFIKVETDESIPFSQADYSNEGNCETDSDIKKEKITILENKVIDINTFKPQKKGRKPKDTLHCETENYSLNLKDDKITDADNTILRDDHTSSKTRVICKICNISLSVRSVNAHMSKRHPGSDERKIKCELCDDYILKTKLNRHLRMMHGTECTKCGYCKREFDNKESLIEHVASCTYKKRIRRHDSSKEMIECDVCQKSMQRASLRMHQRIQHAGLGPVCDHCGRKFGNKLRLSEHLRARHDHDKYRCQLCSFRSSSKLAMRNHERRHRGEKPYVCEACGARFHAAYLLAQHRHSHRTDKPAKCDLCPATFKSNNGLHMHKSTCHSTTVYKCTLCERAYSCRSYVLRHLRSVHGFTGTALSYQLNNSEVDVLKVV